MKRCLRQFGKGVLIWLSLAVCLGSFYHRIENGYWIEYPRLEGAATTLVSIHAWRYVGFDYINPSKSMPNKVFDFNNVCPSCDWAREVMKAFTLKTGLILPTKKIPLQDLQNLEAFMERKNFWEAGEEPDSGSHWGVHGLAIQGIDRNNQKILLFSLNGPEAGQYFPRWISRLKGWTFDPKQPLEVYWRYKEDEDYGPHTILYSYIMAIGVLISPLLVFNIAYYILGPIVSRSRWNK